MMPHMMNNGMMSGVGLFWIIGIVGFLLLVAVFLWLFMRWTNTHAYAPQAAAKRPHDSYQRYEQGYRPSALEAYQEERAYDTSSQPQYEQPSASYPLELPPQQ